MTTYTEAEEREADELRDLLLARFAEDRVAARACGELYPSLFKRVPANTLDRQAHENRPTLPAHTGEGGASCRTRAV